MQQRLTDQEEIDRLGCIYADFDKAFNRTHSRAAIDGGLMLLALLDELRAIRATLEGASTKKKN